MPRPLRRMRDAYPACMPDRAQKEIVAMLQDHAHCHRQSVIVMTNKRFCRVLLTYYNS